MSKTLVQSSALPLELSFDSGTTWKTLVCLADLKSPLDRATNDTDTLTCGRLTGLGPVTLDFSGSGICDLTPDVGLVSIKDLETALLAETLLKGRLAFPDSGSVGHTYFRQGDVLVTQVELTETANDYLKFTFTLKGQGTPTIVSGF